MVYHWRVLRECLHEWSCQMDKFIALLFVIFLSCLLIQHAYVIFFLKFRLSELTILFLGIGSIYYLVRAINT